ncbi:NAD(P)H-dependent glycerol-3-phosphate dehydrogenase [Parvularcula dongshanensis]|uniref:Glycerol-3-phosphate dehydrogenase [NAD(P)+] n=1 Tax=Parvularcula dongshanensis TaxID=1173995 RepID=A0A840HYP0_9PROT|nr:NAD(P)H-dependent glycerol-3-phosphate dehydrogenase [Parvularcula dongshanensis]MBB4657557.1 glycerol-3-phosphate dehydrogenase (NAD(P)+) [Parvularcula dongshanensis]
MTIGREPFERIYVAGAGSWGTALAALCARAGRQTSIWSRGEEIAGQINEEHRNATYLPEIELPSTLRATTDRAAACEAEGILLVVPAQAARDELVALREATGGAAMPVALCCKGIERGTGRLMHQVLKEAWPEALGAVLSGPSFAADVARGLPTAVTLADPDESCGTRWLGTLATETFRPYYSPDVLGAELGGAIKNVLAIACGIVEGRGLGESAKAALMARGFAEAKRFALGMGAKPETLAGLSGLGDLILTCSSRQSRNMSLGYEMGQGRRAADVIAERRTVSEGAATAPVLVSLARERGTDMPITEAVAALLSGELAVDEAIADLMNRPLKIEG